MQQYHLAGCSTYTLKRLQYLYTTNTTTCTILWNRSCHLWFSNTCTSYIILT